MVFNGVFGNNENVVIMKNIIAIVICMFSLSSLAQEEFKHHTINTNLFSLINPYYSSITIGYEFRPLKHFGLEVTYGYIYSNREYNDSDTVDKLNGEGSVYRIEPKIYFWSEEVDGVLNSLFVSVKVYKTENRFLSVRMKERNNYEDLARYNVYQRIKGVIPTVGVKIVSHSHLSVEASVGFGKRWLSTKNDYQGEIKDLLSIWRPTADLEENGKLTKWRINLNLKIGFAF